MCIRDSTDTDRIAELVDKAFHVAESGRPGPVLISLPEDIDRSDCVKHPVLREAEIISQSLTEEGARTVADLIGTAECPCIVVGEGVLRSNVTDRLVEFAELINVPVLTAWRRFDAFPNNHSLYMGALHVLSLIHI